MPSRKFGEELRRLRRSAGLTLADLADAADVSIVYLSDIERGDRSPPSVGKINLLLRRIGCEAKAPQLIALAVAERQSIEIPLKKQSQNVTQMLAALARRCDEGNLNDELAREIRRLLKDED